MATGWLAALKLIPWSDVISNAPMVAEGAKKLWSAVAKKPAAPALSRAGSQAAASTEVQAINAQEARIATLEATVSELHAQMLASSELIKALAEQNAQLIVRAETQRVRLIWLAVFTTVVACTAAGTWVVALANRAA
ncbi:MAG: hypothetical protein ABI606_20485 [Rhodoferax sp.]